SQTRNATVRVAAGSRGPGGPRGPARVQHLQPGGGGERPSRRRLHPAQPWRVHARRDAAEPPLGNWLRRRRRVCAQANQVGPVCDRTLMSFESRTASANNWTSARASDRARPPAASAAHARRFLLLALLPPPKEASHRLVLLKARGRRWG